MVESAIYFPLIILTAIFAISMMLHMYHSLSYRCSLHEELRARASEKAQTGSYYRSDSSDAIIISARKSAHIAEFKSVSRLGTDRIDAAGSLSASGGILTNYLNLSTAFAARIYVLDEQALVRYYLSL